ncbi:MAG: D-alanyl-D-alanine carboxypeptidase/D-alanyl-D-alanine-endopeptidase [Bacteroidetes bacterium]|nr:MAG: D-alanyl-D-alanine carboxypeptidase/D-alanyl-D-alanine-endopeptidase [Bacteroidota bacterium]
MRTRFFAIFSILISGLCSFAQNDFRTELQKILQQPEYQNATVGIQIVDLETEKSLFELNADKLMIPASTLKIITSATALEILGADYRFQTKIGYTGELLQTNELNGDLVVLGGGDPTLGSEYFNQFESCRDFEKVWIQKIKAFGIHKIAGDIVLDGSVYDSEKIPPTWIWGDIGNYYGAGASALTCYDNLFRITFKSPKEAGEKTEIISAAPEIEGLEIVNEVVSSDDNRDLAYVFGSPLDKKRVIRGTIPKDRKAFTIKAAVHHPEELLAEALLNQLTKEGIFISGQVKFKPVDKKQFKTIYIHESPKLADLIKVVNHESVNLFAEHLLLQIAAEKNGLGNREEGIKLVREFWSDKGINLENLFMEDGSGLSHFNAISPGQINAILIFMWNKSANRDVFINSLPVPGKGTLKSFKNEFFLNNALRAKSGSMTRVRCYSGYLQTDPEKEIAFTVMFNHFSGTHSNLIKEIENLLLTIKSTW